MDLSDKTTEKPFKEWQIIGLILIALIALGFGQAIKKHPNNFPKDPLPQEEPTQPVANQQLATTTLALNQAIFTVELAQTDEEKASGLSGRETLDEREGMLFVYDSEMIPSFWMKDMNFAIDIIWIDANKKITNITSNLSPNTFPQTFSPQKPIKYVLEVPAGTAAKNKLKIGDLIHFSL